MKVIWYSSSKMFYFRCCSCFHFFNIWYSFQSRFVRNANPTFIFGVRRDVVDPKLLKKDQIVNHYGRATFTTKVHAPANVPSLKLEVTLKSQNMHLHCTRLASGFPERLVFWVSKTWLCPNPLCLRFDLRLKPLFAIFPILCYSLNSFWIRKN